MNGEAAGQTRRTVRTASVFSGSTVCSDPKNIFIGIWRQIRIEYDRLITEGTLRIVCTMRVDCKYADENGVAKAVNVLV